MEFCWQFAQVVMEKVKFLIPSFCIAFASAFARTILLPHTRGFAANFAYVVGATLFGVLVGYVSIGLVSDSYHNLLISVSAASSREFLELIIKFIKRLKPSELLSKLTQK
jgi:hypothetical protein